MQTFFSNRIYKCDVTPDAANTITELMRDYSSVLHYAYSQIICDARYHHPRTQSLYFDVQNKHPDVLTYIRNTATQEAKALHKARLELLSHEKDILQSKLLKTQKKLISTERRLNTLLKYKTMAIERRLVFNNRTAFKKKLDGSIVVTYKRKPVLKFDNEYLFECQYLQPEINKLKAKIGLLTFKINKLKDNLDYLNGVGHNTEYIPAVQFGTKKLRKQSLNDCTKQQEYNQKRSNRFEVSGRGDSIVGNFVFGYDAATHSLTIKTGKKGAGIVISNVFFRYGQNVIAKYYTTQYNTVHNEKQRGTPITFSIEDKGKYYIIKCSLKEEIEPVNYSKSDGVIGIDTNLGFYSVCETNADGSPLSIRDMVYEWRDKSTNQVKYNIEQQVANIIKLAESTHKPLVIERLKFKGGAKVKDYNNDGAKNFNRNIFAYNKMINALKASAYRHGIEIYEVNPMYTSLIGKIKFAPYYKRSVHQMAALAIARRAQFTKEETIPRRYRPCSSWQNVYKLVSKK